MDQPTVAIPFDLLDSVGTQPETEVLTTVSIHLNKNKCQVRIKMLSSEEIFFQAVELLVDKDEACDLALNICGYYRLYTHRTLQFECKETEPVENVILYDTLEGRVFRNETIKVIVNF